MRVNGWTLRALGGLVMVACGCMAVDDRQADRTGEDPTATAELPAAARVGSHLWSRIAIEERVSPPGRPDAFELEAAVGRRGDTFLGATFTGTLDLGGRRLTSAGDGSTEDRDFAVARYGHNGALRWAKSYGGPGWQELRALAPKGDAGLLVAGHFRDALDLGGIALAPGNERFVFIGELDGRGKPVWARAYEDEDYAFHVGQMAADDAGNIAVTGFVMGVYRFAGTTIRGDGSGVIKVDARGEPLWAADIGLHADDGPMAMGIDAAGRIAVLENSGKFYRMTLVRLGADGSLLWRRRIRTTADSDAWMMPSALAVWRTGEVLVVGQGNATIVVDPSVDMDLGRDPLGCFAAKLDVGGTLVWVRRFASACFTAAAIDGAGQVVLGGTLEGAEPLGGTTLTSDARRPVLVKLDTAGKPISGKVLATGPGTGDVRVLGVDAGRKITLGGVMHGRLDFGGGPLTAEGAEGAYWLARLRP
jgi:outer membrane protein assembly factor BamB